MSTRRARRTISLSTYHKKDQQHKDIRYGRQPYRSHGDVVHSPGGGIQHSDRSSGSGMTDDPEENTPLLPRFSSQHLDDLSVFTLSHLIRSIVIEKCDTVLTWDQLRSPQISQFLVKPIQQEIRSHHLNAATESALLTNALQFLKESSTSAVNSGTNKTRALLCELIAVRLLKEHSARDLVDALSYDFDPLQGTPETGHRARSSQSASRVSCIEIAIRGQAKKFLAHPLVVQHLEAIWTGSIVFHSFADNLHRVTPEPDLHRRVKTISMYNPRDASLFKLSRLRVPRYRNLLSTLSFAVLLVLFLLVLEARSTSITNLEIVFWVWATGYMLDEVLGFTDQGFSLYIASFWNIFDLGILFLLFVHLCLRLVGFFMPDHRGGQIDMASNAYDVLALTAILLFPRLFSVLDHYRYFSQLIIAFRMMATDMLAIFILILVFCSGFLVSLSLAFGRDGVDSPGKVAYALLQMLLGFTPAAWDRWNDYNLLGRAVLVLFLFVCHFVVVTILITVLTNSFMEVVKNGHEEHQYLFAINTVSSVKSDALFAFVPPVNVLQWLLMPLSYVMSLRRYVKLNRTVIKLTHFPILTGIYLYERFVLPAASVEGIGQASSQPAAGPMSLPRNLRAPSVVMYQQEAALEEVFRRPFQDATVAHGDERQKASGAVSSWMHAFDGTGEPPREQNRRTIQRLERGKITRRDLLSDSQARQRVPPTSVISDPTDFTAIVGLFSPHHQPASGQVEIPSMQSADADADDDEEEGVSDEHDGDADESPAADHVGYSSTRRSVPSVQDYEASMGRSPELSSKTQGETGRVFANMSRPHLHARNVSAATMKKLGSRTTHSSTKVRPGKAIGVQRASVSSGDSTLSIDHQKNEGLARPVGVQHESKTGRSLLKLDLISDIGDNQAVRVDAVGALPASLRSSMLDSANLIRRPHRDELGPGHREGQRRQDESERFGRLMMARMNTLEEGFREVVHEVREGIRQVGSNAGSRQRSPTKHEDGPGTPKRKLKDHRIAKQQLSSGLSDQNASVSSGEQTNAINTLVGVNVREF